MHRLSFIAVILLSLACNNNVPSDKTPPAADGWGDESAGDDGTGDDRVTPSGGGDDFEGPGVSDGPSGF